MHAQSTSTYHSKLKMVVIVFKANWAAFKKKQVTERSLGSLIVMKGGFYMEFSIEGCGFGN